MKQFCQLDELTHKLLQQAMNKFGLSHRAYHRILKVARTIADLADCVPSKLNTRVRRLGIGNWIEHSKIRIGRIDRLSNR